MKPLRLRMYGVGPYAEEVDIDFTRLNEEGLFLITGATGAGKTSIFDGITYALYGETNYGDAEKKNGIICDFLDEEDHGNAYVEFSFEVDGTEYCVKRVPAYYKVKGSKRNKTKTGETLEIEAIPSRSIPGKKEDRDRFIREEILRVDAAQFKKLIMLPQGDFSEFIRSNSKAKKETLEKIFDTGIYEEISQSLRNKVKELGTGITKERERIFAKLETLDIEEERWRYLLEERLLSFDELLEIIGGTQRDLDQVNTELGREIEGMDMKSVLEELAKGEATNRGVRELREARKGLEEHAKRSGEVESMERDLGRYRRAQKIGVEHAAKERSAKEYRRRTEDYQGSIRALEEYRTTNDERIEGRDAVVSLLKETDARVNTLEILKKDVERYLDLEGSISRERGHLKDLEGEVLRGAGQTKKELTILGDELAEGMKVISGGLEKAGEIRIEREKVQRRRGVLQGLIHECEKNQRSIEELKKLEKELDLLKRSELEALEIYREQHGLLLQAEAYKLAGELKDEVPCPVCGSLEHPNPATKPQGVPLKEEVEAHEAAYVKAGSKRNRHEGEVEGARRTLEERMGELAVKLSGEGIGGEAELREAAEESGRSLATMNEELDKLPTREDLAGTEGKWEKNRRALEETDRKIQEVEKEIEALRTKIGHEEEEYGNLRSTLEKRGIDAATFEEGLREATHERSRLEAEVGRIEGLKAERDRMESHLQRDGENLKELQESMERSKKVFEDKLADQGFTNEGEYLEGDALDGEVLEKGIGEYRDEGIRLTTTIEGRKEYEGRDEVSLELLREKRDELTGRIEELRKRMAQNTSKIGALEERKEELKAVEARIGKEEKVLSVYKKLSDISEGRYGDKKNNITFQNYVLGVYFEEVLDRANERFAVMTSNQYEMVLHRKEKSGKGEAGLDINVFDSHTGRERSIKTLSGGETFKASMALALGLSDVVQSQNGGIQLDSVFIDEGFGTLDDESLAAAMDILLELKSSGRTVGIISHVNELKQTINCQIRVEKSSRGSSVEVVY